MSSLETQLKAARQEVVTDGYEMSIGEIVSLYKEGELVINPAFQRLFRWDASRKTKFVESLLLGIPIPPIFVFQNDDGTWELIDGLQRTSTVLEFLGELRDAEGDDLPPSALLGTHLLPSLAGVTWKATKPPCLTSAQKLDLRRARLRVEILKRESDASAKFELFQRLNTGGAPLSEQEVRNCTMVMIRPEFYEWLLALSKLDVFVKSISITDNQTEKQAAMELALRFLAFLNVQYVRGVDVHEYLDAAAITLAMDKELDLKKQADTFRRTFGLIQKALGAKSFRRWDGSKFVGQFLQSVYEVMATGVARNLASIEKRGTGASKFIQGRAKALWQNETFKRYSGAGIRGTDRLANLLPMAEEFMRDEASN